jgi:hypothetical protein
MKKTRIILLFMPLAVFADVITLKDGTRITGTVEVGGTQVLIKTSGDAQVIAIERIQSIDFDPPYTPPAPVVTTAAAPPPKPAPAPSPAPAPVVKPQGITLPAGTEIAARTIDRIDSKKTEKNHEYRASLDDPIVVDGVTVAPANTSAILRVIDFSNPHLKGRPTLSMALVAVIVNGRRVDLSTDGVESAAGSRSKRTAIGAGAGAAGGAAVGAAAGGGVGAAVGAGIGAAAGTAGAALTGKGVIIAPETRFTYKLKEAVVLPK